MPAAATEVARGHIEHRFKRRFVPLQVELQADDTTIEDERLVGSDLALESSGHAHRQIEGVAVPVPDDDIVGPVSEERLAATDVGERYRVPADLVLVVALDSRAQDLGDDLRAETHAEHELARCDRICHEVLLRDKPWRRVLVVGVHRPAHDHEEVDLVGGGVLLGGRHARGELVSGFRRPLRDHGSALEGDVLNDMDAHCWTPEKTRTFALR